MRIAQATVPAYYQGRHYIVFQAKSHPATYVYVFPDLSDSRKLTAQAYPRREHALRQQHR